MVLLSKLNIYKLIYGWNSYNKQITIENMDVFEKDFSNESKEFCKFEDLSEYIIYYIKSELNMSLYPENKFLKKNDFI